MSKLKPQTAKLGSSDESEPDQTGYCNPPQATRFKAGKSGNPKGRPKKKPALSSIPHMSEERLKFIIQQEAYRSIPIRDGDKLVEIPIIQAVVRGLAVSAAKGDTKAQRTFTDLLMSVEDGQKALNDEYLKTAMDYKVSGMKEIERCKKLGIEPPEMTPHPDDIQIDMSTGKVEIKGPMTPEDKKSWDEVRKHKQDCKDLIEGLERILVKKPDDKKIIDCIANERRTLKKLTKMIPD